MLHKIRFLFDIVIDLFCDRKLHIRTFRSQKARLLTILRISSNNKRLYLITDPISYYRRVVLFNRVAGDRGHRIVETMVSTIWR